MDAEMPAGHAWSRASIPLWQAAPRAAYRWPVDHRSSGHADVQPGKATRHRRNAACKLRKDVGEISGGPKRPARTRAQDAPQAGLPSPETSLIWATNYFGQIVDMLLGAWANPRLVRGGEAHTRIFPDVRTTCYDFRCLKR